MWYVVFAAMLFVLAAVDQRTLWQVTTGWQYRDPQANEPSDAALIIGRVAMVVTGLLILAATL